MKQIIGKCMIAAILVGAIGHSCLNNGWLPTLIGCAIVGWLMLGVCLWLSE